MPKKSYRRKRPAKKAVSSVDKAKLKRLQFRPNVQSIYTNGQAVVRGVTDNGLCVHLSAIATGDSSNNRTGNCIKPVLLKAMYNVLYNVGSADSHCLYRVLVVQGTQANSVAPLPTTIIESAATDTEILFSHYDNDYVKMYPDSNNKSKPYTILYDSGIRTLVNGSNTAAVRPVMNGNPFMRTHYIRVPASKLRPVMYNGTASTNFANSPIYLVTFSDKQDGIAPLITGVSNLYYDNII